MSKQPSSKKSVSTNKPQRRDDNASTNQNALDSSRTPDRINHLAFLLLALVCFGGAFLCARTIEFGGGSLAVVQLLFQIPAILGTLGLGVLGCRFLYPNEN